MAVSATPLFLLNSIYANEQLPFLHKESTLSLDSLIFTFSGARAPARFSGSLRLLAPINEFNPSFDHLIPSAMLTVRAEDRG